MISGDSFGRNISSIYNIYKATGIFISNEREKGKKFIEIKIMNFSKK